MLIFQVSILHDKVCGCRLESSYVATLHSLDTTVSTGTPRQRWAPYQKLEVKYSYYYSTKMTCTSQSHLAVAVIQSIPIFDETNLFSIPLPKAVGSSISFSYFLHFYLVLMFIGEHSKIKNVTS